MYQFLILLLAISLGRVTFATNCVCVTTATWSSALNVRSSASTSSTILGQVYKDECLVSLAACTSSWCRVEFLARTAYVSRHYVRGPSACDHQTASERSACSRYGDFMKLSPTGASSRTASSDGISVPGVTASNTMVATDQLRLMQYKDDFDAVGAAHGVHPAVVAAIASRESRGGSALDTNGYGDNGNGYGLMQCDINTSGLPCTQYGAYSREHINMLVQRRLVVDIGTVAARHATWPSERQLQGAVAAYNFGTSNVQTWARLDIGTTGNDYSNDVMARAQYLVMRFGWTCPSAATQCVCVQLSNPSSSLNVRSSPGGSIVGSASHGQCLPSTGACSGGWCQVTFNGGTAYVSSLYVSGPASCSAYL